MEKNKTNFSIFIIGALFFVFGFVTWLNNVLIPFLQTSCELTSTQASLVNFAFYISYFVMAIPSSYILKKTGFANGMALGLIIMAIGSILFVPAALNRNFALFLIGLFVQGTGLALLQTAANPYVTILGPIESAAKRQSIMGVCNKVAGMIGILILYSAIFSGTEGLINQINDPNILPALKDQLLSELSRNVILPYIIMTMVLIALMIFVKAAKLPDINEEDNISETDTPRKSIFAYPYLWIGIIALFFYVGAEVVSVTYLIQYGDYFGIAKEVSKNFGIFALIALVVGYFMGIALVPKVISQRTAGIINLILALILVSVALFTTGIVSIIAVILLSFTNAILWPAIWPLSIQGLGKYTKLGSAFLIMSIAGGGVLSIIYGYLSDQFNPQSAYALLFVAYGFMLFFVAIGCKIKSWK
ncbi:MAG: sugar MFS transporter [Bacteroidales bacterium]|jgi:glucose/galactose transporter|nr:sugar MFS transporter [Bacteroidales bacterium]